MTDMLSMGKWNETGWLFSFMGDQWTMSSTNSMDDALDKYAARQDLLKYLFSNNMDNRF